MLSLYLYASTDISLTIDPDHRRHCYSSLHLVFVTHEAATSNVLLYLDKGQDAPTTEPRVLSSSSLLRESTPLISLRTLAGMVFRCHH